MLEADYSCIGAVIAGLNARRGTITDSEVREEEFTCTAEVALNDMFGYSSHLRGVTQGKGMSTRLISEPYVSRMIRRRVQHGVQGEEHRHIVTVSSTLTSPCRTTCRSCPRSRRSCRRRIRRAYRRPKSRRYDIFVKHLILARALDVTSGYLDTSFYTVLYQITLSTARRGGILYAASMPYESQGCWLGVRRSVIS